MLPRFTLARAVALGLLMIAPPGRAAWTPDGVPVTTADQDQRAPVMVHDGAGGAIFAWWDDRSGGFGVYAQRLDADGNPMWPPNGVLVSAVEWVTVDPVAVSDGLGGAYIVWSDSRDVNHSDAHLYAQRIGADGLPQWAAGGVKVCPDGGRQHWPVAISDYRPPVGLNTNGFIVVFQDTRTGSFTLVAQRMDMDGARPWGNGGVPLCTTGTPGGYPAVVTDGTASPFFSAGALVAWQTATSDIRCNMVNANGVVQWGGDGLAVCTAAGDQGNPVIAKIGSRRAIIAWEDERDPSDLDIFSQKVDNGAVSWALDGVLVAGAPGPQYGPQAIDAADGAFVAWTDGRDPDKPLNHDIYAQRVDLDGNPAWIPDGIPVCGSQGFQTRPRLTYDGFGGLYIGWTDGRGDAYDVRAQHANADGHLLWDPSGIVVSGALGNQELTALLLQVDSVLFAWEDLRNPGNGVDVYAGRLTDGGSVALPEITPEIAPASIFAVSLLSSNPLRGEARFAVALSQGGPVGVDVSDVTGRRVWSQREVVLAGGSHVLRWDGRDTAGRPVPGGVYFMRVESGARASVLKLVRAH
jgi:hypothetical protein